jgi:hypothetical protein
MIMIIISIQARRPHAGLNDNDSHSHIGTAPTMTTMPSWLCGTVRITMMALWS